MLPGSGATVASFVSYDMERRIAARKGRKLGTGVIEGVSGPQAADNAAANGAFIPTLSLGIPGSAATAVLLGGFLLHGIQPGPLLMTNEPALVWGLLASFYIGNVMLVLVNIPMAPLFASILRLKYAYLYPAIILLCFIGAFSVNNDMTGVWMAFVFGAIGWAGKRYGYPLPPMILGVVLGQSFERAVVQSAEIGKGSLTVYFHHPIAMVLLGVALLMAFGPTLFGWIRRRRPDQPPLDPPADDLETPARGRQGHARDHLGV
jgi:putative tricarboxylic transport membrane protein